MDFPSTVNWYGEIMLLFRNIKRSRILPVGCPSLLQRFVASSDLLLEVESRHGASRLRGDETL